MSADNPPVEGGDVNEDQIIPGTEGDEGKGGEVIPLTKPEPKTRTRRASVATEEPKPQTPAVGRIVHYTNTAIDPRAAIIAEVPPESEDGTVDLVIFNSFGSVFVQDIPFSEEPKAEHWSWPPRV